MKAISEYKGKDSPPKKTLNDKLKMSANKSELNLSMYDDKILNIKIADRVLKKTCVNKTAINKFPADKMRNGTIKT